MLAARFPHWHCHANCINIKENKRASYIKTLHYLTIGMLCSLPTRLEILMPVTASFFAHRFYRFPLESAL